MQQEVECKFLNVNHDEIREKLKKLGAVCEKPSRLMRRVMYDYPDNRFQNNNQQERLRVRDEGDKITITYKADHPESNYPYEVETTVGSFDDMTKLLESIGLKQYSFQESKRETWGFEGAEIELDEWPWLETYIEIEANDEDTIKNISAKLGFEWDDAKFGSVDAVYRSQYPEWRSHDSIGDVNEVRFNLPKPEWFEKGK